MFQLVYVSTAAWKLSESDLNAILDISRAKNEKLGVTGLLLYIDQGFLQILEGPKEAVTSLYETIQQDMRHLGLRVLIQQDTNERLFGDWNMGFDRPTPDSGYKGAYELTKEAITTTLSDDKAKKIAILLRNFYRITSGDEIADD